MTKASKATTRKPTGAKPAPTAASEGPPEKLHFLKELFQSVPLSEVRGDERYSVIDRDLHRGLREMLRFASVGSIIGALADELELELKRRKYVVSTSLIDKHHAMATIVLLRVLGNEDNFLQFGVYS